ncbi:MAG: ATP-grasp domain-containing protein [Methylococcaceae bacterium]
MLKKILVFEFITGGGLAQQELPESLAREGQLMLMALLNELVMLSSVKISVLLDWRCQQLELPEAIEVVWVSKQHNVYDLLPALIERSDCVWPIAPEIGGELEKISLLVEQNSKQLLNSSAEAVQVCSDKLMTAQLLKRHGIAVVETSVLDASSVAQFQPCIIKPKDGAGCLNCYLLTNDNDFKRIVDSIKIKSDYVIQPYIKGDTLSLCCLFNNGKACLLCCNQQLISINQGRFELDACVVNSTNENTDVYQSLIDQIAKAIPGLWGYVGIDIIHTEDDQALIVEINSRLTTSYVGVFQAIGVNVAKQVFEMTDEEPKIITTKNKQIIVTV